MHRLRFLIPDSAPLSLLALIGEEALNWLFVPQVELWVTDMVREEVLREPGPGSDRRLRHRATLAAWFQRQGARIRVQPTQEGVEYRKAMDAWVLAGRPEGLRPAWADRGERSVFQALDAAALLVMDGEGIIVLADDRNARAALLVREDLDIALMATQSFIAWIASAYGVKGADTAWAAIRMASNDAAPDAPAQDPIGIRRST